MVIFFVRLTAWFNDERFFKEKTPIRFMPAGAEPWGWAFCAVGHWRNMFMADIAADAQEGCMILTKRTGHAPPLPRWPSRNEVIWRTMSTDAWVKIETVAFRWR